MGKISIEMVIKAYPTLIRVSNNAITRTEGKKEINVETGMNEGSASDLITIFKSLLEGKVYKRAFNNATYEFLLIKIEEDFGIEKLNNSLNSIQKHIDYYSTLNKGNLRGLQLIINNYKDALEIDELIIQKNISKYESKVEITQRVQQSAFRDKLLKKECRCQLCEIDNETFLIASHIKPWKNSILFEKVDINNGLLLCPNHDKLFDLGYISFSDTGMIIISERLTKDLFKSFNIEENLKINVNKKTLKYIQYHREHIFKG